MTTSGLGGRLPLWTRDELDPEQQKFYDACEKSVVPWAATAGFEARDESGAFIGPFNSCFINLPMARTFLDFQNTEERTTSLSARARQVVILAVGAVWQTPYETYAHSAVARSVGLADSEIAAVVSGDFPDTLSADELAAGRLARAITRDRSVTAEHYAAAESVLAERGIYDAVNLIGAYQNVCGVLAVFDVPAPDSRGGAA